MPFGPPGGIWAVDGQQTGAVQARLALAAQTHHTTGIVAPGDLEVTALDPAANGVAVAPGGYVAAGREEPQQGSYQEFLTAADTTSLIDAFPANETGSVRYDLVCVRVEDPTVSGAPWTHDPATEPISYLRVIPGAGATAGDNGLLPNGQTGAPIARVAVPASTASPQVTNAMITDLRQVANPLTDRAVYPLTVPANDQLTSSSFVRWPDVAQTLRVPTWATDATILADVAQVVHFPPVANGFLRVKLGSLNGAQVGYGLDEDATAERTGLTVVGKFDVSGIAGESVDVRVEGRRSSGSGYLDTWTNAALALDVQFTQRA